MHRRPSKQCDVAQWRGGGRSSDDIRTDDSARAAPKFISRREYDRATRIAATSRVPEEHDGTHVRI